MKKNTKTIELSELELKEIEIKKQNLKEAELNKYLISEKVYNEEMSIEEAAEILEITTRSVYRLVEKYKTKGVEAFAHGKRNKPSEKRTPLKIRIEVVRLFKEYYKDESFATFTELLREKHDIDLSYQTVRSILVDNHIISVNAHKDTIEEHEKYLRTVRYFNILNSKKDSD